MKEFARYFPVRCADDMLDTSSVLYAGLVQSDDRVLFHFDDTAWNLARTRNQVSAIQKRLRECGIRTGDRVGSMLPNGPEQVALFYALVLMGVVWVPINVKLKGSALQYLVQKSRPDLIVIHAQYEDVWKSLEGEIPHRCRVEAILGDASGHGWQSPGESIEWVRRAHHDDLCLVYTSGTSGPPKAVPVTQRMMRVASEAAIRVAELRAGDRPFLWEPLCHIGGAQMLLVPFLVDVQIHMVSRFSSRSFWRQVSEASATHLHYLGGVLDILLNAPYEAPPDNCLRMAWGAGLRTSAWAKIRERFGWDIRECYGLTEAASFSTVNVMNKPGSIGRALPWVTVQLLDDREEPVRPGETGEIVLSSPVAGVLMAGYLEDSEATARALRGGRLHTGDLARQDADGDLYFVGRIGDRIRVRGENVSAWEIERVFEAHPHVLAAAAVGVESAIGEQEVLLFVQFGETSPRQFDELAAWGKDRLASFQLPRYYKAVERFERTPSERIRKQSLPRTLTDARDAMASKAVARQEPG